jgi:hypothetical protein
MPTPATYTYKSISIVLPDPTLDSLLNAEGANGWELVTTTIIDPVGSVLMAFFKKKQVALFDSNGTPKA